MSRSAITNLPDDYTAFVDRLAAELESAGAINGRSAVLIAALNLLTEFLEKIGADTDQERAWRLQVLVDLAEIRELSD